MSKVVKGHKIQDRINLQEIIEFIERLESTTKDKETADKIRQFLIKLGIWN